MKDSSEIKGFDFYKLGRYNLVDYSFIFKGGIMKVKFTRNDDIVLEEVVTSLNVDENGYVDFYTADNYYYTTTQGKNIEDSETTIWLEMFDEEEDDEAIDMVGLPFSETKVFFMLNETWELIPTKDIFK